MLLSQSLQLINLQQQASVCSAAVIALQHGTVFVSAHCNAYADIYLQRGGGENSIDVNAGQCADFITL